MFVWDFNVIVAIGVTLGTGIVIVPWLFYTINKGSKQIFKAEEFFRQCQFCSYLFFDYLKRKPCRCPRCGSYES